MKVDGGVSLYHTHTPLPHHMIHLLTKGPCH